MSKSATVAERRYMSAVANAGCGLCRFLRLGETPCEIHHQRTGTGRMRASNYRIAGLCVEHHRGNTGFHALGAEAFEQRYGVSEVELVEMTRDEFRSLLPSGER